MSKIISVLSCFIFIISNAYAGSLSESFPSGVSGIFVADSTLVKHLFDVNSEHSALTDCYESYIPIVKEKFGIDFDKDVEQLGYLLFLDNERIKTIGFVSGNFNLNDINLSISNTLASETELFENVELNHKTLSTLKMGNNRIVFYNEKIIWFCDEYEFKNYKEKAFSFAKAPEHIAELSDKSKTFICIKKELWPILLGYNPKNLTFDLDSVDSVSAYLDNSDIVFSAHLDTNKSAEVMKQQFDYFFKVYKDSKKQDSLILDDNYLDLFKQINSLYLSSRIIDIIDSLKLEVKDNNLVIIFPYNRTNYYNAVSDFAMNIAMPAYNKAIEENQKYDCYYAQHFLTKVVEKYNNENEPMMDFLDDLSLRTQDYIPYEYTFLEKRSCRYRAVGHLDKDGYITCEKHGPAVPLIKPSYSKERLAQEEDMLKCILNKKRILDAVHDYNYQITSRYRVKPKGADTKTLPSMTTELNLKILKDEGFLKADLLDIPGCEYYISGNLNGKGYIGCKKHGLLTNGQLYNQKYDYYFRRPELSNNKRGYRTIKEAKMNQDYDEEEINFTRNYRIIKKELEYSFIGDSKNDKYWSPCQKNIKIINYALEMYNMDNAVMMTQKLDLSALKKGYLRTPLEEVSPECEYYINGDITRDGYITCKKHGPLLDTFKNK